MDLPIDQPLDQSGDQLGDQPGDHNDGDVLATLHAIFKEQPELWRHSPAVIPSTVVPAGVSVRADTEAAEPIAA